MPCLACVSSPPIKTPPFLHRKASCISLAKRVVCCLESPQLLVPRHIKPVEVPGQDVITRGRTSLTMKLVLSSIIALMVAISGVNADVCCVSSPGNSCPIIARDFLQERAPAPYVPRAELAERFICCCYAPTRDQCATSCKVSSLCYYIETRLADDHTGCHHSTTYLCSVARSLLPNW